ncbi:MAG: putative rane protein, partial [Phycisphaerales bacterium]|nr:putative rane protein [Phycisphaerales bacterium]
FFASLAYFTFSAIVCERAFHPTWHDDQMHAVQVQMLAKGYLWHAPHQLAEFFDTFHIFVRPVYAPIHFPGTSILNVVGVWLGLNYSAVPLVLISLACVFTYLVVTEIIGGAAGLTAMFFLWASAQARMLATMETSHNAMIFLGVLTLWLFLRWRKNPGAGWSLALGLFVALAGFTRPADALAFAVPIGLGVLVEAIRHRSPRRWLMIPLMVLAGLPLVAVQLAFDKGVTGNYLRPPYQAYNDEFHPFTSYGSVRRDRNLPPVHVSDLVQKQAYYEQFMLPQAQEFEEHSLADSLWNRRLPTMMEGSLPGPLMFAFVPMGFFAMRSLRRAIVATPAVLMVVFYLPHAFFLPHYPPIVNVAMATLALLGIDEFSRYASRWYPGTRTYLSILALAAALFSITPLTLIGGYEYTSTPFRVADYTYEQLPKKVETPALVFCRISGPNYSFHDEPVYNSGAAWPDDAKIVLAQHLGPHNADLVKYYANLGQNRHVYVLDRNTLTLQSLGTVESIVRADENRKKAAAATQAATRPQE